MGVVVVAPNPAYGELLAAPLARRGVVEVRTTLAPLEAGTLYVACLELADLELQLAACPADVRAIAIVPDAALTAFSTTSERIIGVLSLDAFNPLELVALVEAATSAGGLQTSCLSSAADVERAIIADHSDQQRCLAAVAARARRAGMSAHTLEATQHCFEELVTNALYAAPVDADGRSLFEAVSPRDRIRMRSNRSVTVEFGSDGSRFALVVRDDFGSLRREVLMRVIAKCLHDAQPIDHKLGGAGVGLYLVLKTASSVTFTVVPGVATQIECTFDLERPYHDLGQVAFIERPSSGRPRIGKRRGRGPSIWQSLAIGVALAVAAVATLSLVRSPTVRPPALLAIDSTPSGATVEASGRRLGSTPFTTALPPGHVVVLVFKQRGYRDTAAPVVTPAAGRTSTFHATLAMSDRFARVRFVSEPPGARVTRSDGSDRDATRTFTPVELLVEVDQVQHFTLTMPNHAPLVIEPFTPKPGAEVLEKGGTLIATD